MERALALERVASLQAKVDATAWPPEERGYVDACIAVGLGFIGAGMVERGMWSIETAERFVRSPWPVAPGWDPAFAHDLDALERALDKRSR